MRWDVASILEYQGHQGYPAVTEFHNLVNKTLFTLPRKPIRIAEGILTLTRPIWSGSNFNWYLNAQCQEEPSTDPVVVEGVVICVVHLLDEDLGIEIYYKHPALARFLWDFVASLDDHFNLDDVEWPDWFHRHEDGGLTRSTSDHVPASSNRQSSDRNGLTNQQEAKLDALKAKLDALNSRTEKACGPNRVILTYESAVVAFQWRHVAEPSYWQVILRQPAEQAPPIRTGFWDAITLIVPTSSGDFKAWLWETLDHIVTDYVNDWQVDKAQPPNAVLIHKRVADKRVVEVSPRVWVIDVDVEGTVIWCDIRSCDPDVDAGEVILLKEQVLDSALSFKIIPTGDSTAEARCFCGTQLIAQQFYEAKNLIMERWPGTRRSQHDTDVSFRSATTRMDVAEQKQEAKGQSADADTALTNPPGPPGQAKGTPGAPRKRDYDEAAALIKGGASYNDVYEQWHDTHGKRHYNAKHSRDSFNKAMRLRGITSEETMQSK